MILRNLTLKKQLILLIAISLIMMIFVQFFFNYRFYYVSQDKAEIYAMNTINMVNDNLNLLQENIKKVAMSAAYNTSVQEYLQEPGMSNRTLEKINALRNILSAIADSNDAISDIAILDINLKILSAKDVMNFSLFKSIETKHGIVNMDKPKYLTMIEDNVTRGTDRFLCYVVPIYNMNPRSITGKKLGICVVLCDVKYVNSMIQNTLLTPASSFFIIDDSHRIVTSNRQKNTQEDVIALLEEIPLLDDVQTKIQYRGSMHMINIKKNPVLGWKTISIIPVEELNADLEPIRISGILIGLFTAVLLLITGVIFSRSITGPIEELIRNINHIGEKNIKQRIRMKETNEIGTISKYINRMLDKVETLASNIFRMQMQLYEAELQKKEAEVSALQSQINPHFLYNTLECIRSIGMVNGINEIVEISGAMARIFRYSIKEEHYTTINREIECIKDYLRIIEIRFDGKIKSEIAVDPELKECRIIKMIMQPIVENAVYHGLEKKEDEGTVSIQVKKEDNCINIVITDDGIGMDHAEVRQINSYINSEENDVRNEGKNNRSIGLKNINSRIKLYYGNEYGIHISSAKNVGTRVELKLPLAGSGKSEYEDNPKIY